MNSIFSPRSSRLNQFLSKFPAFSKDGKHSLGFLNSAQFLGVINDNVFKLVMVFLLIETQGKEHASIILSAAGAIFVIPFLLFSSAAGILADRFSKQRLFMIMKASEVLLMLVAIFAFAFKSPAMCYTLLFFLATHSALIGPSKYGIIPELVSSDQVPKANGLITSFTYLAIIIGTFLASFLTEVTDHHFPIIAGVCLLIAILGFLSTFGIKLTSSQGSKKELNPFFIREIYHTLVFCKQKKHLLLAICGSSFFLFVGAYTQLNIIPFAMESLHLSDVAGGYLFLSTAVGIVIGAFMAGRASKKRVELGLSCLCGFLISLFLLLLAILPSTITGVVILLVCLGVFGGCFIVPFDSFVQIFSPHEKRGQVIAAASFLSFAGVLIASFALYLFSTILNFSAATGFGIVGIITLIVSFIFTARLSDLSLPYLCRKVIKPFYKVETPDLTLIEKADHPILILQDATLENAFLLLGLIPDLQWFVLKDPKQRCSWLYTLFYSIHPVKGEFTLATLLDAAKHAPKTEGIRTLFVPPDMPIDLPPTTSSFKEMLTLSTPTLIFATLERAENGRFKLALSKEPLITQEVF